MAAIPIRAAKGGLTGDTGYADLSGVQVGGRLISWEDLAAAVYVASQCCREGSRKHDDLYQAAFDYLPSLQRHAAEGLEFCGIDNPAGVA